LTFVLPKQPELPNVVTAGGTTVALRLPAHPLALALIRAAEVPIAAPSANPSTRISATTAEHVLSGLEGRIDLVLDGGPTPGGLESTVLDVTCSPPRLLRPGLVSPEAIEALIGPIVRGASAEGPTATTGAAAPPPRSPGLMARHYAPRVPLVCVAGGWDEVQSLLRAGFRVGWLAFGDATNGEQAGLTIVRMPIEPVGHAAQLYAALHALESADVERIVVSLPPEGEGWLAVHDRLRRASTPLSDSLDSGRRNVT
jgi:L-threonylcarbamoyladenylate synthase